MANDRLFSETEVAEIVRRAAELQDEGSATGYVPGITSAELQRVAREVGIEARYLEAAISEINQGSPVKKKFKWVEEIERVLPVELDPNDFDVITDAVKIAPVSNHKGVVSGGVTQVGRSLQGQVSAGWDQPHFKVSSRGGRTKLSVRSSNGIAVAMGIMWTIPLMMAPVVGAVSHNWGLGVAAAISCIAAGFLTTKQVAIKGHEATRQTADKLEKAITDAVPTLRENLKKTSPSAIAEDEEKQTQEH